MERAFFYLTTKDTKITKINNSCSDFVLFVSFVIKKVFSFSYGSWARILRWALVKGRRLSCEIVFQSPDALLPAWAR